eukprot:6440842-Pyramimonas_sp.AAC.1
MLVTHPSGRRAKCRAAHAGPLALRDAHGQMQHDRSQWPAVLEAFCKKKYHNPAETRDRQHKRLQKLDEEACREEARGDHRTLQQYSIHYVLQARSRMAKGKAAGQDDMVNEMLLGLSTEAVYAWYSLFRARLAGGEGDVESWTKL